MLFLLLALALQAEERDLTLHFPGYTACLEVKDTKTGRIVRHGGAQCQKPLSPCSTFKIPNSLIALETGVASGPEFLLKWDGVKRDRPELNQDHTLETAIRDSVVWYYQELARRIGQEQKGSLPVSARAQQVVRDITRQPWTEGVDYHGKTGSCGFDDGTSHGWWVGFVKRGEKSHVFAANILGKDANGRMLRPMVEKALVELGVLPAR